MIGKLSEEQIEEVLNQNVFGHLGCNDGFNTYVYPVNYVFNGRYIICHSQPGSKIQVMRQNKRVCFQVEEISKTEQWKSVMVFGVFRELEEERERYDAMKLFVDRNIHLKTSETAILTGAIQPAGHGHLKENSRPVFYSIFIDEKSGRYENEKP